MAETKLIIPEGQSIRFTPVTYYMQPTGSQFYNYEAPQNRHYDNGRHLLDVDLNRKHAVGLYPYSFGSRQNYQVQQIRMNEVLFLFWRSQLEMTATNNTLKAYDLAGTLLHTFSPLGSLLETQYNDASYEAIFEGVKLYGSGAFTYVYFDAGDVMEYAPYQYYLYGNIPEQVNAAITGSFDLINAGSNNFTNQSLISIDYIESLNVFALKFNHVYNPATDTGDLRFNYVRSSNGYFGYKELIMPVSLLNKCFYLEIEHDLTDDTTPVKGKWRSDLLKLSVDMTVGMVKFTWKNSDSFGMIDYRLGESSNTMYLQADYFDLMPSSDQFTAQTERGVLTNFNPIYKRRFKLRCEFMPRHLVDLLYICLIHEYVYVNGKRFTVDLSTFEAERIEKTMLWNVTIEIIEYEINGIYAANYPFGNLADGRQPALKIDEDNYLEIGGGNRLRIM